MDSIKAAQKKIQIKSKEIVTHTEGNVLHIVIYSLSTDSTSNL